MNPKIEREGNIMSADLDADVVLKRRRAGRTSRRLERLRQLDPPGNMPDAMRMRLTESQRGYAGLVRKDHERQGYFDLSHHEAGIVIGCNPTTVLVAQNRLRQLGWIAVKRRGQPPYRLSNIVTIISPEWLAWIGAQTAPHKGGAGRRLSASPLLETNGDDKS
jgi:hypothetical protein